MLETRAITVQLVTNCFCAIYPRYTRYFSKINYLTLLTTVVYKVSWGVSKAPFIVNY